MIFTDNKIEMTECADCKRQECLDDAMMLGWSIDRKAKECLCQFCSRQERNKWFFDAYQKRIEDFNRVALLWGAGRPVVNFKEQLT